MPEGVVIIDDKNTKWNFINPHLKNVLDLDLYCPEKEKYDSWKLLKKEIDNEFNEAIEKLAEDKTKFEAQTDINSLMNKFVIIHNWKEKGERILYF